jgi:hypothetical protein
MGCTVEERLSENAHLPFDKLMALSEVEGLRYPHPSSLRRTSLYASFLGISEALHMDIFHQPLRFGLFYSLGSNLPPQRKMKGSGGLSQADKAILNLMLISLTSNDMQHVIY